VNATTPAIVTQSAVRRLPRLILLMFCLAYVLPGFLGREPWKVNDVEAFGAMLGMASGSGLGIPQVLGVPLGETGPLPFWLGAAAIQALPFLSPDLAVRLAFAALLALTLALTWYAVFHLARQPAAQPVTLAFGGEAHPTDYARALADAGLLALMASLGLAQLGHETTPDLVRLCATAAVLYGAARLALPDGLWSGAGWLGWVLGLGALVSSGAPWLALALGAVLPLLLVIAPQPPGAAAGRVRLQRMAMLLAAAVLCGLGVWALPQSWFALTDTTFAGWQRWSRLLLWFAWPAWPLALWTLWRWRRQWRAPHLALPLWVVACLVLDSAFNPGFDRALLLSLPAWAALAAFALPTLRRSMSALIDWFTLLFFSSCALIVWVVWLSMMTGVPAKPAANVARLAPGFVPEFSFGLLLVAALATGAWLVLVAWRVGAHRKALWKSLVLPAAGSTLCWLLLMSLWLPLLDHARSYGPISRRIASLVPPGNCVLVDGLSQAQIAALGYHGRLTLVRTDSAESGQACRTLVVDPDSQPTLDERVQLTDWAFRATVRRLTDRKESLLIYQRVRH